MNNYFTQISVSFSKVLKLTVLSASSKQNYSQRTLFKHYWCRWNWFNFTVARIYSVFLGHQ